MNQTAHKILVLIALTVLFVACSAQRTDTLEVKFTNELTQTDLDEIQEDLKTQNISLTYSLLEFDEQGNLKKISASIDYNDGQKGSFESRELEPGDNPGFRRDFSKN